jgi:hypothetical protein
MHKLIICIWNKEDLTTAMERIKNKPYLQNETKLTAVICGVSLFSPTVSYEILSNILSYNNIHE